MILRSIVWYGFTKYCLQCTNAAHKCCLTERKWADRTVVGENSFASNSFTILKGPTATLLLFYIKDNLPQVMSLEISYLLETARLSK
jgi:hypothetical protein